MRKLSVSILLLTVIMLVLSACSKKEETPEQKFEGKSSIKGVVEVVEAETLLIESRERIHSGKIIVSKKTKEQEEELEFGVGDIITVYYDGNIAESDPAQINTVYGFEINKKAEYYQGPEKEKKEGLGFDDIDYYEMPLLTSVHNGKTRELTKDQSALIHDLINGLKWDKGAKDNFKADYTIMENEEILVEFDSKTHTLNDTKNDISIKLYEGLSETLKETLDNKL